MSDSDAQVETHQLVEHFFRHESGKLNASLVHQFGVRHFELVEDMVQCALAEALLAWKQAGVPREPAAWVHRVARNKILDALRRKKKFQTMVPTLAATSPPKASEDNAPYDDEQIQDSLLRMLFMTCHPALPIDAAIPLTLRTVAGFGEQEIATCLLVPRATIRKRVYRAKRALMQRNITLEIPSATELRNRLPAVHNVLYLMFNEGYASNSADQSLRLDVCEEAARLCHLLTEDTRCCTGTTHALLALMLFHASRFGARIDQEGALVLLEDQDRELWDRPLIGRAMDFFKLATHDSVLSNYHIEAAIAMHHCVAPQFVDTDWSTIIQLYDRLLASCPSPVYQFNRAIAVGWRDGPQSALAQLHDLRNDPRLQNYHLLDAAFGEFYRRAGKTVHAYRHFQAALLKTNSRAEKQLLERRLQLCSLGERHA